MKKRHVYACLMVMCLITSVFASFFMDTRNASADESYRTIRAKISTAESSSIDITVGENYRIVESPSAVLPSGAYSVCNSGGNIRIYGSNVDVTAGSTLTLERCQSDGLNTVTLYNTRYSCNISYLGNMTFCAQGSGVRVINTVPIEQYLYGVVGYEMSNSFPMEALKAQAVVARGYAIRALKSASSQYDIGDTSSDQVYRGYPSGQTYVKAAVDATSGQVMTYNGEICCTYFAASNGGQTELPGNAWGGGDDKNTQYPYLAQKDDPYDLENPSSLSYRLYVPRIIRNTSVDPAPDLVSADIGYTVQIVNVNHNCSVYESASDSSTRIGVADKDNTYTWIADSGNYYQIDFNGTNGYVKKNYAIKIPEEGAGVTGALPTLPVLYDNVSPVLADLQEQAYQVMAARGDSVPDKTNIRLLQCTDFRNGQSRYTSGNSRCYVSAEADLIVQYVDNEGNLVDNVGVTASIVLMNYVDGSYVLTHDYLSSNCRMRLIESTANGFDVVNRRYGHGIGLSQRGAQQMALSDKDYQFILTFYFTGAALSTVDTSIPVLPEYQIVATEQVVRIVLSNPNSYVNVRSQPATSSGILGRGYHNVTYPYIGKTGSWWIINYNGQTGYVYQTYGALETVSVTTTPTPSPTATPTVIPTQTPTEAPTASPSPTVTPTPSSTASQMVCIKLSNTSSYVNVRSKASTSSAKLGKAYNNEQYAFLGKTGSWWIINYNGQTGYVYATYGTLEGSSSTPTPTPSSSSTEVIRIKLSNTSTTVCVRSKASSASSKLGTARHGQAYAYLGKSGSWWKIEYNGKTGYVYSRYGVLETASASSSPAPTPTADSPQSSSVITVEAVKIILSNTSSYVNIRSGASSSSSKLGIANHGALYKCLGESGSWYGIQYGDKTGYVHQSYAQRITAKVMVRITLSNTSSLLNVRSGASTSTSCVGSAKHNAEYDCLGSSGEWYFIQFGDEQGYVLDDYATLYYVAQ